MNDLSVIDARFLYNDIAIKKSNGDLQNIAKDKSFKEIYNEKKSIQLKKLKKVSYQLESIFVNMMLKEMRKNINKYRLIQQNPAEKIFQDMLYQEYSLKIAESEQLGFARTIYDRYSKYL